MSTDRPDVTESTSAVPRGSIQIENGLTLGSDHGKRVLDLSESMIRLGVRDRTEVRLVVPNYLNSGPELGTGFDDPSIGIKQQFGLLPGRIELAVIFGVSLPTGQSGVGSGGFDPFVKFPWARELKRGWSVGGQQSLYWNSECGRRNGMWEPTFYLARQLSPPLDAFVEYVGNYERRGAPKQILHFGASYKVTPLQMADFHFGFGLNAAAPNNFFAVGYSVRFDHLWR